MADDHSFPAGPHRIPVAAVTCYDTPYRSSTASRPGAPTTREEADPDLARDVSAARITMKTQVDLKWFMQALLPESEAQQIQKDMNQFVTSEPVRRLVQELKASLLVGEESMSTAFERLVTAITYYDFDVTNVSPIRHFAYVDTHERVVGGSTAGAKRKPDGVLLHETVAVEAHKLRGDKRKVNLFGKALAQTTSSSHHLFQQIIENRAASVDAPRNGSASILPQPWALEYAAKGGAISGSSHSSSSSPAATLQVASSSSTPDGSSPLSSSSKHSSNFSLKRSLDTHQESQGVPPSKKPRKQDPTAFGDVVQWSQVAVAFELKTASASDPERREELLSSPPLEPEPEDNDGVGRQEHDSDSEPPGTPRKPLAKTDIPLADVQLASYLMEMRAALGHRTHTYGCLVRGMTFQIWFSDAFGIQKSRIVDIESEPSAVAAILVALARSDIPALGFDPDFLPPQEHPESLLPYSLKGWRYQLPHTNQQFTIEEVLYVQWSLFGRGTAVYRVKHGTEDAALKISYPYSTRAREADLIEKARAVLEHVEPGKIAGVPRVYASASGDLVTEGYRRFLPGVERHIKHTYNRRREALVMELLRPLRSLRTPRYVRPFIDILYTIKHLSDEKVYHRDVSSGNLMLRKVGDGWQGVLADFDLAVDRSEESSNEESQNQHRTGTLPFLAIEILNQWTGPSAMVVHTLRFDLESGVYVFVHDTLAHPEAQPSPVERSVAALADWFQSDPAKIASAKYALATELRLDRGPYYTNVSVHLEKCKHLIGKLLARLLDGMIDCRDEKWEPGSAEWANLGGKFTFESVIATFEQVDRILNPTQQPPQASTSVPTQQSDCV